MCHISTMWNKIGQNNVKLYFMSMNRMEVRTMIIDSSDH